MKRAFVFPGQGSQKVGMGRSLAEAFPAARELFEEVDEALKQNLSRLVFAGPEDALVLTENAQPALMAVSLAAVRVMEKEAGVGIAEIGAFVAGHSLGEYSALAAAGALAAGEAARLLRRRGEAMQRAVPLGEGAMIALLGAELADAEALAAEMAEEGEVLEVANDNAPGQVVLSGHASAVARAEEAARTRRLKVVRLPVSAPFHCALMAPAAEAVGEALAEVVLAPPAVPLVANVTAGPVREPETIRRLLVEQVTARVRWRESVLYLRDQEVDELVEVGPGGVLSGLARRIAPELGTRSVGTAEEVEAFLASL